MANFEQHISVKPKTTLDVVWYKMWTIRIPVNFTAYREKLLTSSEYCGYYVN